MKTKTTNAGVRQVTNKRKEQKLNDESDAWDRGDIGSSEQYTKRASPVLEAEIDDAMGLQQVTIRLQKTLIADLKVLAKQNGLGYQPFVRQLLTQHVRENRSRLSSS